MAKKKKLEVILGGASLKIKEGVILQPYGGSTKGFTSEDELDEDVLGCLFNQYPEAFETSNKEEAPVVETPDEEVSNDEIEETQA